MANEILLEVDLDTGELRRVDRSPGRPRFKRRDSQPVALRFLAAGVATSNPTHIRLGLKKVADWDGDLAGYCETWTTGTGGVTDGYALGVLDLNLVATDDLFEDPTTEPSTIQSMLEATWSADESTWTSSRTLLCVLENDVITGDESPAVLAPGDWESPADATATEALFGDGAGAAEWRAIVSADVSDASTTGGSGFLVKAIADGIASSGFVFRDVLNDKTSRVTSYDQLSANRSVNLPDVDGNIAVMPIYDDNAAALAGGLSAGVDIYWNLTTKSAKVVQAS
jgi:hypothetical protein